MAKAEYTPTSRRVVAIAGMCVLAVGCNLLLPGAFWEMNPATWIEQLAFAASGALVAEVCLLGIWCGLSRQAIKFRLPITLALVLLGACSYSLGLQLPDMGSPGNGIPVEAAFMIAGAGFGMFVLLQLPLWLIRRSTSSRIATLDTAYTEESLSGSQFSVGYLMLWTALVGVLLVIVRNSLPENSQGLPVRQLVEVVMVILVYIGLSSLLCIPCVWIALGERPHLGSMLLLAGALSVSPFLVQVCTSMIFQSSLDVDVLVGVASYEVGLTGTTLVVLLVLRSLGYRVLVVGR